MGTEGIDFINFSAKKMKTDNGHAVFEAVGAHILIKFVVSG